MFQILLAVAAGLAGYLMARNFVRSRLRFVDAIHAPWAPLAAGMTAFLVTWPVALLPLVTATPAVLFGLGTAFGTARGAKMVRRSDGIRGRITS
jgi:hypothetical protein